MVITTKYQSYNQSAIASVLPQEQYKLAMCPFLFECI